MRFLWLLIVLFCFPAYAQSEQSFADWVTAFKQEALSKGISQTVVDGAFADIEEPSDDVLDHDQTQPEQTKLFPEYASGLVTVKKVTNGREEWQSHKALIAKIEAAYGVPAPILISLWGIESNYGARQGEYSIVQALATLAYDGRRSQFFRSQLLDALRILEQEQKSPDALTGSWAGAMGQVQFMPASFLQFAVDFDGDGKRDIWNSDADALASMANYLHQKGWDPHTGWGIEVKLPNKPGVNWLTVKGEKPLWEWQRLGVRRINDADLPQARLSARLVMPDDNPAVAFLVFSNYNVLMNWNRSTYFATAVGLLADAIGTQ